MIHPLMRFLRIPLSLQAFTISIEKEIGRILDDRYGIAIRVGQIGSSRQMAAQVGRHRPTESDNSRSSSSSSSSSNEWMEQEENDHQRQQQLVLQKQQEAYDAGHDKLDGILRGESQLGRLFDNSYKNITMRGEHFHLYRQPRSDDDGRRTAAPDIEADSNLLLLEKVTKEVIASFLADGGPARSDEYDLGSNNIFRNATAATIYQVHGNASESSHAEGRGEGGGQLPMDALSTYNFFCKMFGVEWKDDSWQRVTETWPYPDGIHIGVMGIGYGEEWLLIVAGWRELQQVDRWREAPVPALRIVGFEIDDAVSAKCRENIVTRQVQDVVSCATADFFEVGVLAKFDSSIVAQFELSHFYTTAAVSEAFALHIYMFGILHGLVMYTDAFNKDHFVKAYKHAYPRSIRGVDNPDRLTNERLPQQLCIAYVRGGDDIVSRRPIFEWNVHTAMMGAADHQSAIVPKLAGRLKSLTEDSWVRSKGSHSTKLCREINAFLDLDYYRSKSFLYAVFILVVTFPCCYSLWRTGYSSNDFWKKACSLEMTNLTDTLDPRCKKLMRWSILYLQAHKDEATARLLDPTRQKIRTNGQAVRTFNSYLGDAGTTRRFVEEYVCQPVQEVVRIIITPHHI